MEEKKVIIIGAGPAGASLAYYLKRSGINVEVFEARKAPGLRPCGWGIPKQIENFIELPREFILNKIDAIDLYLDERPLYNVSFRGGWGFIVNKPAWLSYLLRNIKVHYGRYIDIPSLLSKNEKNNIIVVASGIRGTNQSTLALNALEILVESQNVRQEKIEFWFDSSQVGYTWVFPRGNDMASVGVGAFRGFDYLRGYLYRFLKRHPALSTGKIIRYMGDKIAVGGLSLRRANPKDDVFFVGEAVGAVFPITGEGIRPSIMTSYALSRSILYGTSYIDELGKTGLPFVMNLHKIILWTAMNSTPEERARMLSSIPLEKSVSIATGDISYEDILESFPHLENLSMNIKEVNLEPDEIFNLDMEPANK